MKVVERYKLPVMTDNYNVININTAVGYTWKFLRE